jgi:hypothetical protein
VQVLQARDAVGRVARCVNAKGSCDMLSSSSKQACMCTLWACWMTKLCEVRWFGTQHSLVDLLSVLQQGCAGVGCSAVVCVSCGMQQQSGHPRCWVYLAGSFDLRHN